MNNKALNSSGGFKCNAASLISFFRRKPKVADLPDDLDVQEDDVVTDYPIPQHALFSAPQGQSQAVAKVFVERNRE